jgi:hypothetical protein
VFHRIGRDGGERAGNLSFAGNLAASDRIDGHSTAIRRILHREPQLKVQRDFSKPPSFHSEEADLIVILPGDIIGRADVNILWLQWDGQLGLNRLCFGDPFVPQTISIKHVEEVGIAACVNLIGSVQSHPPIFEEFRQGSIWDLTSSPTAGSPFSSNRLAH